MIKKYLLTSLSLLIVVSLGVSAWVYISFKKYAPKEYMATTTSNGDVNTTSLNATSSATVPVVPIISTTTTSSSTAVKTNPPTTAPPVKVVPKTVMTPTSPVKAPTPAATSSAPVTPAVKTYTMADVEAHASQDSCYTVISDYVYDVTFFINAHPGGKGMILSICGKDGTQRFLSQHYMGGKYEAILNRFKIAPLQK